MKLSIGIKRQISFFLTCLIFHASPLPVHSQEETDVWNIELDSLVVTANTYTSGLKTKGNGEMEWKLRMFDQLPNLLGNADPLHFAQMLPGVQTNGEYREGVNILGCENSHNLLSIAGIPLFGANHLFGFFSPLNTSHYQSMYLKKTPSSAGSANRLGGELMFDVNQVDGDSVSGEFSLGLLSSQGTIKVPLGKRTAVIASARGSYANLLYSRWLKVDETQVRYSFADINTTVEHQLSSSDLLSLDFYWGHDYAKVLNQTYGADIKADWGNTLLAAHWNHDSGAFKTRHSLYFSSYANAFLIEMGEYWYRMPSAITEYGYKGNIDYKRLTVGADLAYRTLLPQMVEGYEHDTPAEKAGKRYSEEASLYANYVQPLSMKWKMEGGVRFSLYGADTGRTFWAVDPSASISYETPSWQASLTCSTRHQYLVQTGFSYMGLPTGYWLPCDDELLPQKALSALLSVSYVLPNRDYRLSADIYCKHLENQIEYHGTILDLLDVDYDPLRPLLHGRGENYGGSIMINKCSGKLVGWVSYSYARAVRRFAQLKDKSYPAFHERPHELNVVATYNIAKHWDAGATFVAASGTAFTAAEFLMFINNNILLQYGEHNANRLSPYVRLDLSGNYKWKSRRNREHRINFSIYNATGRNNHLFYFLKMTGKNTFRYKPVGFACKVMPSVSYSCSF